MELVINALILMVLGMGFVFMFLGIQILLTKVSSKIAAKYSYLIPEPQKAAKKKPVKRAVQPAQNNGELVAVITSAIQQFNS
ncbi:MAG: OadG family protein [Lentisphaeria bacterium]